jgi:hypothetical protein
MEIDKIEKLVEKYFDGQTTILEEKELKTYFSSNDVAPNLKQYQPLFVYYTHQNDIKFDQTIALNSRKSIRSFLSIAASVVVIIGIGFYFFNRNEAIKTDDLGTYEDPEAAFLATQKALSLLSNHLQVGYESIGYINEYENTKNIIFK